MTKNEILCEFNEKLKKIRLEAMFEDMPASMSHFFSHFVVKDAYEVDVVGEYSDEGEIFDYAFLVGDENEEFVLAMSLDYDRKRGNHSYGVLKDNYEQFELSGVFEDSPEDWKTSIDLNKKITELLNGMDFPGLAVKVKNRAVEEGLKEAENELIGKTIIGVEFEEATNSYFAVLDNGEKLFYKKEESQMHEQHL